MCGIVGFWDKTGNPEAPIGATVLGMLEALACRGPDSAGVALFGAPPHGQFVARVKLGENGVIAERAAQVTAMAEDFGGSNFEQTGAYLRFAICETGELASFLSRIEAVGRDVEVVSVGRRLEIIKQVGSPANLERTFGISRLRGSHGLGHTRLSTESVVDLSHSQPFWGHGYPDLAIVHNGHITNYHQLRRRYEQRGVRFYTENDSEVIAIYLAEKLRGGLTLREALTAMLKDLDGSFSCLAATESALGFVKDRFSLKPLMFAESDRFAVVATEEIAIRTAVPAECAAREARASEVQVWQR
jgi:glutamate synthase domain-containing protein 1